MASYSASPALDIYVLYPDYGPQLSAKIRDHLDLEMEADLFEIDA